MMSSIDNTIKINLEDEDKGLWNISVDEQLKYFLKIKPDGMRQDDFNIVLGLLCCQPNKTLFDFSGFNLKNDEKNLLGKLQRQDYTLKYPELNTGDKDAIALMYSGGVDSIAASLLYEKPIKIFAGYGGWFERESDIIDLLGSDFIVTTNFRLNSVAMDKSIPSEKIIISRKSPWTFILSNYFFTLASHRAGCIGLGTILEAAPLDLNKIKTISNSIPLLKIMGIDEYSPTRGLTEVSTSLISAQHYPNIFDKIISSTAAPNSLKYYRKKLIQLMVDDLVNGKNCSFDFCINGPKQDLVFADKFLLPAFKKWLGSKFSEVFPDIAPDEVIDIGDLRSSIYFKFNAAPFSGLFDDSRYKFSLDFLRRQDLSVYQDGDYEDYSRIRDFALS